MHVKVLILFFFFQAEDGIRDIGVTGVQTCALPIWSGVAVKAIETQQHRSEGKRKLGRIAADDLDSPQQFSSIISIAWPPKCAEKLMRMRLEQDRAGSDHFSPLASLIAWSADVIETT